MIPVIANHKFLPQLLGLDYLQICCMSYFSLNPLMLTTAKSSLTIFDEIFLPKAELVKYLMEKCLKEHHQQLPFKYFVKSFSIPKLLSKVSKIKTTISEGLSRINGLMYKNSFPDKIKTVLLSFLDEEKNGYVARDQLLYAL